MNSTKAAIEEVKPALNDIAIRLVNGKNDFVESVMQLGGMAEEDAKLVTRAMLDGKLAKQNFISGRIDVKHGSYLNADTLAIILDNAKRIYGA